MIKMIDEGSFPFAITREVPNAVTLAAIRETEDMRKHPEAYKGYSDVDEMMSDILSEYDNRNNTNGGMGL